MLGGDIVQEKAEGITFGCLMKEVKTGTFSELTE